MDVKDKETNFSAAKKNYLRALLLLRENFPYLLETKVCLLNNLGLVLAQNGQKQKAIILVEEFLSDVLKKTDLSQTVVNALGTLHVNLKIWKTNQDWKPHWSVDLSTSHDSN